MTDVWSAVLIAALMAILGLELYTYLADKTTLSGYVVKLTQVWPLLPFVAGLIIGALATHFWWPWCSHAACSN